MNKPLIPRNVATAIERLRSAGASNETLTEIAIQGGISPSAIDIRTFALDNFDAFLAALIKGYEVEKIAEEIAEEQRQAAHERIRSSLVAARQRGGPLSDFYDGYDRGVKQTLSALGIKICGVNAPEGVNT